MCTSNTGDIAAVAKTWAPTLLGIGVRVYVCVCVVQSGIESSRLSSRAGGHKKKRRIAD